MSLLSCRAAGPAPTLAEARRVVGYAAVFNAVAVVFDRGKRYREKIAPGAFAAALASTAEVYACLEHRPSLAFATRSAGQLTLAEDSRGLFWSAYLPETPAGEAARKGLATGHYRACSFGFRATEEAWSAADATGLELCEVRSVELIDVSLVREPAYAGAVASIRSKPSDRARRLRLLRLKA